MSRLDPLSVAISMHGMHAVARECGVTYQAVQRWLSKRRMPRTEWTGETLYSERIQKMTGHAVTKAQLLAPWPEPEAQAA